MRTTTRWLVLGVVLAAPLAQAFRGPDIRYTRPQLMNHVPTAQLVSAQEWQRQLDFLNTLPARVYVSYTESGVLHSIDSQDADIGLWLPTGLDRSPVGASADSLLRLFAPALLAMGSESLHIQRNEIVDPRQRLRVVAAYQSIRGVEVRGSHLFVATESDGRIREMYAHFLPDRGLPTKPRLSAKEAAENLLGEVIQPHRTRANVSAVDPALAKLQYALEPEAAPESGSEPRGRFGALIWCLPFGDQGEEGWVDAMDGRVLWLGAGVEHHRGLRSVQAKNFPCRQSFE